LNKVVLALVVHSHQPVGNFDHVIEEAYQKTYRPFVELLLRHPRIQIGLHFSGCLLEWIEQRHPEFFGWLKELTARGQVELMGGGFYEPVLSAIPDADKSAQILRLSDYIEKHFGIRPQGAWLTERVWRQDLVRPLAESGMRYIILDDTHFIAAGVEPEDLHGTRITEDLGVTIHLVPSLKRLRYTIPFRDVEETIGFLHEGLGRPDALFAAGDDAEKFGIWPGTYDLCYTRGWLERFFQAIEHSGEWLETTTLSRFMAVHKPLGRVYLPTASYPEMMEWALPVRACEEFKRCLEETEQMPSGERFRKFLLGGTWQGFFSKYPESNQIHKLMLEISGRLHKAEKNISASNEIDPLLDEARTHLLAAQCNDAYWHGLFGGLYSPHLRSAALRNLIAAETLLDRFDGSGTANAVRVTQTDFDVDGDKEVVISNHEAAMVLKPSDGGAVSSLRFKPAGTELINSLMRRPEIYHSKVRLAEKNRPGPSFSGKIPIEELLRYDRYLRHCFRTYLFPASKRWKDFDALELQEDANLAGGEWELITNPVANPIEMSCHAAYDFNGSPLAVEARKILHVSSRNQGFRIECSTLISSDRSAPAPLSLGIELVFNLLAANAPDRYFVTSNERHPLEFAGEIENETLELVDEWQGVRLAIEARPRCRWWIAPIRTVSQSETGFEAVYQGSAILAVWGIDLSQVPESRWVGIEVSRP
jgi:hypothetical protein